MALAMQCEQVRIEADHAGMDGMLWLPEDCLGLVLFVNGGGNSRVRPPNDYVASMLHGARLGTLWLDLLTPEEARNHASRFDIGLLTDRLDAASDWLQQNESTSCLSFGLYGTSNCSAAVLQLAGTRRGIFAIVSRGGRCDLAAPTTLTNISAPTLLIAGGLDDAVVRINREAYAALRCKKQFEIIPGATHSFEEPGTLEVVARLARNWFLQHSYSSCA